MQSASGSVEATVSSHLRDVTSDIVEATVSPHLGDAASGSAEPTNVPTSRHSNSHHFTHEVRMVATQMTGGTPAAYNSSIS